MFKLSDQHIPDYPEVSQLQSYRKSALPPWLKSFRRLILLLLLLGAVFLFLPWTQNVQANGKVTTLRPEQRPQTIHATISGRIEKWYVVEGQAVKQGDTIMHLSEVKADYFDPQLVDRMDQQVAAKQGSIETYGQKAGALNEQIAAMRRELESKITQINNKTEQARLKIRNDSLKVIQAGIDLQIARRQLEGAQNLYEKGLKSLTDLEEKRSKLQDTETKAAAAQNQLASSKNDLAIYLSELRLAQNETANKIAKAESDLFSALGDRFNAEAGVSKLKTERQNYALRSAFYYILAPQDGYIIKAIKSGIGEIVKEGEPVVSIQPADYELAVELFVRPIDLPLLAPGHPIRVVFDGWPSFFFSGWPGVSMGTFGGKIASIDRNISSNGKFRVLVAPDASDHPWPDALQPGGGAKGIAQLKDVPVWYEIWRILNGFPPDFYEDVQLQPSNEPAKK